MCGHGAAHGGWAMGARYLILILPLLLDLVCPRRSFQVLDRPAGIVVCRLPFPLHDSGAHISLSRRRSSAIPQQLLKPFSLMNIGSRPRWQTVLVCPAGVAGIVPVLLALLGVICVVCLKSRQPKSFALAALGGSVVVGVYVFPPNLDDKETQFRRATIAERCFRPANRLESIRDEARTNKDWKALQRVNDFEWTIADARAFAPDDFPYLETRALIPSPTAELKRVVALQKAGNSTEGEHILQSGKETYSFGRCDFSTNQRSFITPRTAKTWPCKSLERAVTGRQGARPNCVRSQFLLGSLYQELNRNEDARRLFREFMANSEGTTDPETKSYRQKLSGAGL